MAPWICDSDSSVRAAGAGAEIGDAGSGEFLRFTCSDTNGGIPGKTEAGARRFGRGIGAYPELPKGVRRAEALWNLTAPCTTAKNKPLSQQQRCEISSKT
jgi:hypothetical protein